MKQEERALVRETKALVKNIEAGRLERAAWLAVQTNVARLKDGRTQTEVGELLGRGQWWVKKVLGWDPTQTPSPFGGVEENKARYERHDKTVLRDPERRRRVFKDLTPTELSEVVAEADDERHEKMAARKGEHRKDEAIANLTGEGYDDLKGSITESWCDAQLQRVWSRADELDRHVRKWGLVLGSLDEDEALTMAERAERQIAEFRAAVQERVRDKKEMKV